MEGGATVLFTPAIVTTESADIAEMGVEDLIPRRSPCSLRFNGFENAQALSTAPLNRVSELPLSARHSREGGNPDVVGKPLAPRLRGGDGTTKWALYSVEAY